MELMREGVELDGVVGSDLQKMFVLQAVDHHQESLIIPTEGPRRDQCETWSGGRLVGLLHHKKLGTDRCL